MDKKKILHIVTLSRWGGAQQVCLDIAVESSKDHEVAVACKPGGRLVTEAKKDGIKIIENKWLKRELCPLYDLIALISLIVHIISNGYQVVHCHSTKAGIIGRIASALCFCDKTIFTVHGWGFNNKEYSKVGKVLRVVEYIMSLLTDVLVCVSKYDYNHGKKIGIGEQKLTIIHNGANVSSDLRNNSFKVPPKKRILFIGRMVKQKAPLRVVKVAKKISQKDQTISVTMVGRGPLMGACEEKAHEENIYGMFNFVGHTDQVEKYLESSRLLLMLSRWEGLPLTAIEALFAGKPVFSTDVGGMSEIITNTKNGILFDSYDPSTISEKILKYINDENFMLKVYRNNKRKAEAQFSLEKMRQKYLDLYN